MPESSNQHGIERDDGFECDIGRRIEHRPYTEIDGALSQLLQALLARHIIQRERYTRVIRRELLHGSRQDILNRRLSCSDCQLALLDIVSARFKVFVERSHPFHKWTSKLIQELAFVG